MKRWKKIIVLAALTFAALGCTMQADMQAHWPGKHNAIQTYETRPSRTVYRGYTHPTPADPSKGWLSGVDLGLNYRPQD